MGGLDPFYASEDDGVITWARGPGHHARAQSTWLSSEPRLSPPVVRQIEADHDDT